MRSHSELIDAIATAGEAFAAFVEGLDDASFRRQPADGEWSAAELTGHVSEFPKTFAEHAVRVAANPGAPLGRRLEDEGRLSAVARVGDATPVEAAAMVRRIIAESVAAYRSIPPAGWEATGSRVSDGVPVQLRAFIETVVADHLRVHLAQARAAAGA